jgi:hypothetical protein
MTDPSRPIAEITVPSSPWLEARTMTLMSIETRPGDVYVVTLRLPAGQPAPSRVSVEIVSEDKERHFSAGTTVALSRIEGEAR